MLVYGDHAERADPRARLTALAERFAGGPFTHDELTGLFVDLSGVAQGVADADFDQHGFDRHRPSEEGLLTQLTTLAGVLLTSWDAGRSGCAALPPFQIPGDLPARVEIRVPEGYAFYALRPEAYGLAARALRLLGPPRVIGLRSIGSGLGCMAAAALGAPAPITVRPTGDPFGRRLRIDDALARDLLAGEAHYVVVDEGPGMSGSSFGCVADWLEDRGIRPDRIAFLPGHPGPLGHQAGERHRCRWNGAQRPVTPLDRPARDEIERLTGPLTQPLRDLSGGQWRTLWNPAETQWPAIDPTWERRKFLARSASGSWLVKWAGLGAIGEARLALADRLQPWTGETLGLTGGWLVARWHEDAAPTRPSLAELTGYLRARSAIPAPQEGAPLDLLVTMARRNVPALAKWSPDLSGLRPHSICSDNRLAAHEWLRLADGRLLKADALDHHQAHDLVGCQDIGWDVAGAIVELDLSEDEAEQLRKALAVDSALLAFFRIAYRAFRIGAHRLSAASLSHWPDEQRRHLTAAERLERSLPAVDAVEHAGDVH